MIYRKTPPQPGRLLLRIVATTGAGTLLGVVACGGKVEGGGSGYENVGSSGAASGYELTGVAPASGYDVGSGASSGYAVMGATGNAFGYGPMGSSGNVLMGTTGSGYDYPVGPSGSGFMTGTPTDYPIGSVAVPADAGVIEEPGATVDANGAPPDVQPDSADGGGADATNPDAGPIVLGLVIAPPEAGADP